MKYASKIKLTEDDFVLVGLNYNYFMIPRLVYPKENLEKLKQQILQNQKMVEELMAIWCDEKHDMFANDVAIVMEKYFSKKHLE